MKDEAIRKLLARYYQAHALDDPALIGHSAFAEPLLQRVLVEELGGDSFEQAFLEGNLLHPEDGYERAAQLAEADYEVDVSGDSPPRASFLRGQHSASSVSPVPGRTGV